MEKKGKCVGGPRNGVMVTAGPSWSGRIENPAEINRGAIMAYYPGRYVWDDTTDIWVWVPTEESPRKKFLAPRVYGHNRKPPN